MQLILSFSAIFIAWIWVDYFRMIDIYEREKPVFFFITFLLGMLSVFIALIGEGAVDSSSFKPSGGFAGDLLYCFLGIGVIEEFAKLVPFLIMLTLFKKEINEPVDYFIYIAISALGFSAAENILYFLKHGPSIVLGRSILSTFTHIFSTSLIACGFIIYKYRTHRHPIGLFLLFFGLASLSHGFFDFWLLHESTRPIGLLVDILYFFITISVFATILNNALNYSTFFSYKKVVNSQLVVRRMLLYYIIVLAIQMTASVLDQSQPGIEVFSLPSSVAIGLIILVAVLRLSRFKLIPGRWNSVRIELPFKIILHDPKGNMIFKIAVKGDSFNETYVNAFYEENFFLVNIPAKRSTTAEFSQAYIEKKLFLGKDETYYLAKVYEPDGAAFRYRLLRPKTTDITLRKNKYPIVAVLNFDDVPDLDKPSTQPVDFVFENWAYLRPLQVSQ
ncbi:MAG TPA: PrsW family glutamic-type intramembrane protease [Bacteroidales bacterium]|nr:PrsW family glutamic-type intramembrane protease [Bacteroidales bacterium]HPT12181.1 PrsW family glutamic-type intramembrane protease [Bacteroidales bacterium]